MKYVRQANLQEDGEGPDAVTPIIGVIPTAEEQSMTEAQKCPKCGARVADLMAANKALVEMWTSRQEIARERDEARDEVERLREALDYRIRRVPEIALPTEADLDWMMNAFQRHTWSGGDNSDAHTISTQPDRIPESLRQWWRQNVMDGAINARVAIGIIIRTWEAGRAKAALALAASEGPESERSGR